MVIHYGSKEIWGSFVSVLLYTLLAVQIINWGNKEYLLRQFSKTPHKIKADFSKILFARLPLVLIFSFAGFLSFEPRFGLYISLWLFGRYLNHSFESLVVFEKKFYQSMMAEWISFSLFCIVFYALKPHLSLYFLLIVYSLYQLTKGLFFLFLFRDFISVQNLKIDIAYYKTALPFFLLSVLGFLASKIDVYLIEHLGNKTTTADYQVINSLLVFAISFSAFIYVPFTKNIYRNNEEVIQKTKKLLGLIGLYIVPITLLIIYFILKYYLNLRFPAAFYCIAFLYIYPSFLYGIEVVNLFKHHKEKTVVWYLLFSAMSNALLSALFLYLDYGVMGALGGSAIAQLIALFLFKFKPCLEK